MTKNIGSVIKRIRTEKGLKQIFVAENAGISNRYLSGIESGAKKPTLETIEKIAGVLNVSLPVLFLEYVEENAPVEENKREDFKFIIHSLQKIFD